MPFPRSAGVLLHPTSLPGGQGIGDLGAETYRFIDFLIAAGQRWWQVLPLGPTGYGDSPYQPFSAFAGNHLLISLEVLAEEGLLSKHDLPTTSKDHVDYGQVVPGKERMLKNAYRWFQSRGSATQKDRFTSFCTSQRAKVWLEDYALFRALKDANGGKVWTQWDKALVRREPAALAKASVDFAEDVQFHKWLQYEFYRQWGEVKAYANQNGIQIIGDVPIFVSHDSSDVWGNPSVFHLDEDGNPLLVAGVPPDYFSETGQLWGNPLYKWEKLSETGFSWWVERMRWTLSTVDVVRIDHFRGFEAYWEIPAGEPTAVKGKWVKAPGEPLFLAIEKALGKLQIIAEDLGVITPEVTALRDRFNFPGMRVLQFGFIEEPNNNHLAHNFTRNSVAYTGTHDNDTTLGWYQSADEKQKAVYQKYLGDTNEQVPWSIIRLAMMSVADVAIVPVQDLLSLGTDARMNFPGKASGNWSWRLKSGDLTPEIARRLHDLTRTYAR